MLPPSGIRGRMMRNNPFKRLKESRLLNRNNRRYRDNDDDDDDENEDELQDMYQELGVTPPPPRNNNNVRYTHPLLHEFQSRKRVILCIGITVLLSTLIGVFTSQKGREEALHVLSTEEEKLHDYLQQSSNQKTDGSEVLNEAQRESEEYRKVTELYMPAWYRRDEGWTGQSYDEGILFCAGLGRILCPYEAYCPLGKGTSPLGGGQLVPQSWAPLIDYEDGWVQIGLTSPCNQWKDLYTQPPAWGETGAGSEIITEHIMCCAPHKLDNQERPGISLGDYGITGSSSSSSGGTGDNGSGGNSSGGSYPKQPSSGSTTTTTTDSNWEQIVYQNNDFTGWLEPLPSDRFQVGWFNRLTDWDGTTFTAGLRFCAKKQAIVCPFEAICPNGIYKPPVGGERAIPPSEDGIAWAPIIYEDKNDNHPNSDNEWVAVSKPDLCVKYTGMHPSPPDWAITDANKEGTRNIACCKNNINYVGAKEESSSSATTAESVSEPSDSASSSVVAIDNPLTSSPSMKATAPSTDKATMPPTTAANPTTASPTHAGQLKAEQSLFNAIADIHSPVWYDRDSGWTGQSWPEAKLFCEEQTGDNDTLMQLCDLGFYCPMPHQTPMHGFRESPADDDRGAWSPFGNLQNGWVKVDRDSSCTVYNTIYPEPPSWGLTGEGAEAITRNVQCCKTTQTSVTPKPTEAPIAATPAPITQAPTRTPVTIPTTPLPTDLPTKEPTDVVTEKPTNDKLVAATFDKNYEKFTPIWFGRSAWKGKSYLDAIEFCGRREMVPCPYEAYCPLGPGIHLQEGMKNDATSWAPIIDVPNGWVQVGSINTCQLYNSLYPHPPLWGLDGVGNEEITQHIMCCNDVFTTANEAADMANKEPLYTTPTAAEQTALDRYHPYWMQRKHGYAGTTHTEATDFCKHISDMELCPLHAYCPDGKSGSLFYGREAFSGLQWAPIASDDGPDWVQIGNDDEVATCDTYSGAYNKIAPWDEGDAADLSTEIKQHVLCCQAAIDISDPSSNEVLSIEQVMADTFKLIWYGEDHGWNGGSHNDAQLFCSASGNKELCPNVAICPNGRGTSPMGGHKVDFYAEGEQWAPVGGGVVNEWVQIGQMFENRATTCMDYEELLGQPEGPAWGVSPGLEVSNVPEKKKYVACCEVTPSS